MARVIKAVGKKLYCGYCAAFFDLSKKVKCDSIAYFRYVKPRFLACAFAARELMSCRYGDTYKDVVRAQQG